MHTYGNLIYSCFQINIKAILFTQFKHLLFCFLLLSEPQYRVFRSEDNVVKHAETLDKFEVLMHHSYAECGCVVRAVDFDNFSILQNLALFGLIKSEKNRHKSGLACAVFAEKRMNFATSELQRDVVVGDNPRKLLCDMSHFNDIIVLLIVSG